MFGSSFWTSVPPLSPLSIMQANEDDVFEQHVMRHVEEPYHRGTTQRATHRHREDNPSCGDSVEIELVIDMHGCICEAWFQAAGCSISRAAASMLTQRIEGMTADEAMGFGAVEMLALFRARLTAQRQSCCLLSWKALQVALRSPATDAHG